ncbi:GIY-YIG catalytic domain protein [Anaerococcus lactolyticus ATCC 51172]|uniref:GIY-YIG catalytic domain protein n=1 Tax=Anaerococcus lactolyticus ATCC 51172 TaxID=525254 RepID=C2BCG3_9FIRM|nr:GIY-YIG nuclease family protein [Anaerococcus lactolyticus]EEI87365.1 GIY-YIG catalytic domain protein [Anaerococcus lactolyticus ATCC 51172]
MHFVYIVRCEDGSLYTGYTTDVKERLITHNSGKGAKYTRSRLPVSLVYYKRVDSKSMGLRLEARIKKLTKKEKEALVKAFNLEK